MTSMANLNDSWISPSSLCKPKWRLKGIFTQHTSITCIKRSMFNPHTNLALLDTLVKLVECLCVVGQTLPPLLMFLGLLTHVEAGDTLIKLALQLHSFLPLLQIHKKSTFSSTNCMYKHSSIIRYLYGVFIYYRTVILLPQGLKSNIIDVQKFFYYCTAISSIFTDRKNEFLRLKVQCIFI